MPAVNGFQLTDSDLEIFVSVFEHRFVTIDHLILLTNRPHKRLHRRLLKLIERGYLSRIILPVQKHIYTLGRAAIPMLVERGIAPKEFIDVRLRHQELKELFLKHAMMIVDVHSALTMATRTSHIKLVVWNEGQELFGFRFVQMRFLLLRIPADRQEKIVFILCLRQIDRRQLTSDSLKRSKDTGTTFSKVYTPRNMESIRFAL